MARPDNKGGNNNRRDREEDNEFIDRLVHINRVAKTVKGGRNMSFAALVIVGDEKGRVGFGKGKAREVPEAIRKATEEAKKTMIRVPLREGRTLHHDLRGRHGAGKIIMQNHHAFSASGYGCYCRWSNACCFGMSWCSGCCCEVIGYTKPV